MKTRARRRLSTNEIAVSTLLRYWLLFFQRFRSKRSRCLVATLAPELVGGSMLRSTLEVFRMRRYTGMQCTRNFTQGTKIPRVVSRSRKQLKCLWGRGEGERWPYGRNLGINSIQLNHIKCTDDGRLSCLNLSLDYHWTRAFIMCVSIILFNKY